MTVTLTCPECRRFLAEVDGMGRVKCRSCGCELTYKSKAHIAAETPKIDSANRPALVSRR